MSIELPRQSPAQTQTLQWPNRAVEGHVSEPCWKVHFAGKVAGLLQQKGKVSEWLTRHLQTEQSDVAAHSY
jgi:hypothetical protein